MPKRTSQNPEMRRMANQWACTEIDRLLQEKGLTYLKVLGRGDNLVIYSEEDGEKDNRARLTRLDQKTYMLGMANHRGKWEMTPFTGTIPELITMLVEQFSFILTEF